MESSFRDAPENKNLLEEEFEGMAKSNVDLWFLPIKEKQLAENIAFGDHALSKIKSLSPRLVLAYLPNAATRESYVSSTYKGRKKRFIQNITVFAQRHELKFIDMSNDPSLKGNGLYSDFHHWNETGSKKGTKALAAILGASLDK